MDISEPWANLGSNEVIDMLVPRDSRWGKANRRDSRCSALLGRQSVERRRSK